MLSIPTYANKYEIVNDIVKHYITILLITIES